MNEYIERLRELLGMISQGRWAYDVDKRDDTQLVVTQNPFVGNGTTRQIARFDILNKDGENDAQGGANAEFLCAAKVAVPMMFLENDSLKARVAELETRCEDWNKCLVALTSKYGLSEVITLMADALKEDKSEE